MGEKVSKSTAEMISYKFSTPTSTYAWDIMNVSFNWASIPVDKTYKNYDLNNHVC